MGSIRREQRREPRYPVRIPVEVEGLDGHRRQAGVTRNAGSRGLLIECGGYDVGDRVRVLFQVRRDGRVHKIEGDVVRTERGRIAVRLERAAPELLAAEPPRGGLRPGLALQAAAF
jgi:hypothetical protein